MSFKQLSALLLAASLVIPSVSGMDAEVLPPSEDDLSLGSGPVEASTDKSVITKHGRKPGEVKRVKREQKAATGKAKKSKTKTARVKKDKKGKLEKKKVQQKKEKTAVAKLGKFDKKGSIKSFKNAADALINYMETSSNPTAKEKFDLYMAVGRFSWATGHKKGFDTKEHYNVAIELLRIASDKPGLFTPTRLKFINKWLAKKETELKNLGTKKAVVEKKAKKVKKTKKELAAEKSKKGKASKGESAADKMKKTRKQKAATRATK